MIVTPETDLRRLLDTLAPRLLPEAYVFCSLPDGAYGDYSELLPLAMFQEREGLTLVIPEGGAKTAKIGYTAVFRCITLTVHSSLEAVGLTAAVSAKLAQHGISANIIAAYHHDHVFVPIKDADRALAVLTERGD